MANAGRVELDLVAVGKDQVSAMLRQVESQARQMATGMKEAGAATGDVGAKLDGLKGKASGVNKVREVFENLRSNAFFVVGAIGAIGAVIGDVVSSLSLGTAAMERWDEAQGRMADGLKRTQDILSDIDALLGKGPDKWEVTIERVSARMAELSADIGSGEKAIKDTKAQIEATTAAVPGLRILFDGLNASLIGDQEKINKLKKEQRDLEAKNLELMEEQSKQTAAQVAMLNWIAGKQAKPAGDKQPSPFLGTSDDPALSLSSLAKVIQDAQRDLGGRGGGVRRTSRTDTTGAANFSEWAKLNIDPATGGFRQGIMDTDGADFILDAPLGNARDTDASKRIAGLEATGDALFKIGDSFSYMASKIDELDPKIGGLFESFGSIANIWKETGNSAESLATGVIGSVDAIATASSAWFKDEKARTRFLGAKELLLAAPLWFVDPAQAAAKTATGLGLLALAGGGGGGSSASGGRGSNSASGGGSGGGPATIVYQFSTLLADQQSVNTGVRRASRAARGTGHESRAGV